MPCSLFVYKLPRNSMKSFRESYEILKNPKESKKILGNIRKSSKILENPRKSHQYYFRFGYSTSSKLKISLLIYFRSKILISYFLFFKNQILVKIIFFLFRFKTQKLHRENSFILNTMENSFFKRGT